MQLGTLAERFRKDGWKVESATKLLTPEVLGGVDALVISGAFKSLRAEELEAIGTFLLSGGRLAIMLHIAPPMVPLLHKLGVVTANGLFGKGVVP